MQHLKHVLFAARVVAIVALAIVFLKVAPTLVAHATGHSSTYAGAPAPRGH